MTALPPWIERPPSKLKKRAPASSAMTWSGARSQALAEISNQTSARPETTRTASWQPPMLRTAQ